MFEGLQELFGTILVGGITLINFFFITWLVKLSYLKFRLSSLRKGDFESEYSFNKKIGRLSKLSIKKRILAYRNLVGPTVISGTLLIACYAIGSSVEDLNDTARIDKYDDPFSRWALRDDIDHKIDVLFDRKKKSLTPLGRGLALQTAYINQVNKTSGTYISGKKLIQNGSYVKKVLNSENVESFVSGAYYIAKNWTYNQTNYASEIRLISNRIEFSESGIRVSFLSSLVLLIVLLAREVLVRQKIHLSQVTMKLVISAIAINIAMFFTFYYNYRSVNKMHNERVFGYYIDHFNHAQIDIASGITQPWIN